MSRSYLKNKWMRKKMERYMRSETKFHQSLRNSHQMDEAPKNRPSKHISIHCKKSVQWLQESTSFGGHSIPKGGHRRVSGIVRASMKRETRKEINAIRNKEHGYNAIRTIAIFSSENPDSEEKPGPFNKKVRSALLKDLKNQMYVVVPCEGLSGKPEDSFAVINISKSAASNMCEKYQQTSCVFTTIDDDGAMPSNIPFSTLESVSNIIFRNVDAFAKKMNTDNYDSLFEFAINRVGMTAALYRKAINKDLV